MIKTKIFPTFLICLMLLAACTNIKEIEMALLEAGENGPELERLLSETTGQEHRALEFLISNMPGHGSFDNRTYQLLDSLLVPIGNRESWEIYADGKEIWERHNYRSRPMTADIRTIDADYLSATVKDALNHYQSCPWNAALSEADFFEYLLPYRSGDEPLTDWRNIYRTRFGDSINQTTDMVEAANIIAERLAKEPYRYNGQLARPHRDAISLLEIPAGDCIDDCDRTLYAMRACGIPTAIDGFLISPDNGGSHRWNVLIDNITDRSIPFDAGDRMPSREPYLADYRKKGKVYRMTYGIQRDREETLNHHPHVPKILRNTRMKDVTAEYFGHNAVEIPLCSGNGNEIYLGIFTPGNIREVDFGEKKSSSTARFSDIEPNVIFFSLSYSHERLRTVPVGDAFMLDGHGNAHLFSPDSTQLRTISLTRKMPLRPQLVEWMESGIVGCRIEGSNSPDAKQWDLLYQFDSPLTSNYHTVNLETSRAYRYYRIMPPVDDCLQLAEIEFFGDFDCHEPIRMDIYCPLDEAERKATDGDQLTYYIFSPERSRIIFKNISGKPLKSIALSARNDDNYVWPSQEYELLYFDKGQWRSCGRKVATGHSVEFEVPENAVFWLRNLTKGREEQVFLYRDGRQLFNMDL